MKDALPVTWRRVFIVTSCVTVAAWLATLQYLSGFDGWGQWAGAPLLLPSVALSIACGVTGILLSVRAYVLRHHVSVALIAATLIGATPISYYLIWNAFFR